MKRLFLASIILAAMSGIAFADECKPPAQSHSKEFEKLKSHYCMLGNRPNLALSKSSPTEMTLDFAKNNTINPQREDHMHSVRFVFIDSDTLVQNWSGFMNGKEKEPTVFKLSRVK